MSKEEQVDNKIKPHSKEELLDLLVHVYNEKLEKIENMEYNDLAKLLKELQLQEVRNKKNPNSFFIIKDLPAPKSYEVKTSSKGGILVFIAFFVVMFTYGGLMLWMAFK